MKTLDPLPYFKWLWRDWRANRKVQRMHYIARGLYRELLDEQWSEGSIPDNVQELADICGCPLSVMELYWPEIEEFFEESEDDRLINPKLEKQRTDQDTKRVNQARAGRIGAFAKLNKAQDVVANAGDCLTSAEKCHIAEQSRAEQEHTQSTIECEEIGQENDMRATKQIPILCHKILGVKVRLYPESTALIQELEAEYKGTVVANAFAEWARSHRYDEIRNPVMAFLAEADDLLGSGGVEAVTAVVKNAVEDLVCELSYAAQGNVIFDNKAKALFAANLEKGCTATEIVGAFKEYYRTLLPDEYRFAGMRFSQGANQLVFARRMQKQEATAQAELFASEKIRIEREAAEERAKRAAEKVEEPEDIPVWE